MMNRCIDCVCVCVCVCVIRPSPRHVHIIIINTEPKISGQKKIWFLILLLFLNKFLSSNINDETKTKNCCPDQLRIFFIAPFFLNKEKIINLKQKNVKRFSSSIFFLTAANYDLTSGMIVLVDAMMITHNKDWFAWFFFWKTNTSHIVLYPNVKTETNLESHTHFTSDPFLAH